MTDGQTFWDRLNRFGILLTGFLGTHVLSYYNTLVEMGLKLLTVGKRSFSVLYFANDLILKRKFPVGQIKNIFGKLVCNY